MPLEEQWHMIKNQPPADACQKRRAAAAAGGHQLWLVSLRLCGPARGVMEERARSGRGWPKPRCIKATDSIPMSFPPYAATAVAARGLSVALPLSAADYTARPLLMSCWNSLEHSRCRHGYYT